MSRISQIIALNCYILKADKETSNIASAILGVLNTSPRCISRLILDNFEAHYKLNYTLEGLYNTITKFNLNDIYPIKIPLADETPC